MPLILKQLVLFFRVGSTWMTVDLQVTRGPDCFGHLTLRIEKVGGS